MAARRGVEHVVSASANGWPQLPRGSPAWPDERARSPPAPTPTSSSSIPTPTGPLTPEDLHFRHKLSPYLGAELRGRVLETWLRGEQIFSRRSQFIGSAPRQRVGARNERPRPARHRRVPTHRRHERGAGPHHAPLSHAAGARVHAHLRARMEALGMTVRVDAAGNLRGLWQPPGASGKRLILGSHIDTVPDAGAFDGVLGVALALEWVELAQELQLPLAIEVIAFSEEEGVRFGVPFLGSRAVADASTLRCSRSTDATASRSRPRFAPSASIPARSAKQRSTQMRSALSRFTSSRARCLKRKVERRGGHRHRGPDPPQSRVSPATPTTPAPRQCTCAAMRWPPLRSGSRQWKRWRARPMAWSPPWAKSTSNPMPAM